MTTQELVKRTLENYPKTRDSDRLLMLYVWHFQGLELTPAQRDKFMDVGSSEAIRRERQKFQEKGLFTASEAVKKQRRTKSYIVQQNAPSARPERLGKIIQESLL